MQPDIETGFVQRIKRVEHIDDYVHLFNADNQVMVTMSDQTYKDLLKADFESLLEYNAPPAQLKVVI